MIIFRYLAKELYSHLLAITMILFAIFITNKFMLYLKQVAKGHITLTVVGKLILLQIPLLLGFLLPLALFLGILLVFARLYMDHEMTVLSACGVSHYHLLRMVLTVSFLVFFFVAGLMLWFEPLMESYRERVFDYAIAEATIGKIIPQQFEYFGDSRVFYAENINRQKKMMDNVFFATKGKLNSNGVHNWDVTIAKVAQEQTRKTGDQFLVFNNGARYLGTPGLADFETVHFDQYGIRPQLEEGHLKVWPKSASTLELWNIRETNRSAAAELQWRIAMPISVLILSLLAFPLSRVNPRQGKFTLLLPAVLLYMVYGDLLFLGRAWIKKGHVSPELGLWWVHGLMVLIVIVVFFYRHWQQRKG